MRSLMHMVVHTMAMLARHTLDWCEAHGEFPRTDLTQGEYEGALDAVYNAGVLAGMTRAARAERDSEIIIDAEFEFESVENMSDAEIVALFADDRLVIDDGGIHIHPAKQLNAGWREFVSQERFL